MEGIVFHGTLEHFARGVGLEHAWLKRYVVLHEQRAGQEATLDWYGSEADFKFSKINSKKTLYVKEFHSFDGTVLISDTSDNPQLGLNALGEYCNNWTLKVNVEKSKGRSLKEHAWLKRYVVLHEQRAGQEATLDWYGSEADFKFSKINSKKTLYVKEFHSFGSAVDSKRPFTFRVYVKERSEPFIFAADCKETLELWLNHLRQVQTMVLQATQENIRLPTRLNHKSEKIFSDNLIYESFEKECMHSARIVETDGSRRSGLSGHVVYTLVITPLAIQLTDNTGTPIGDLYWPYKYIRRYGRSRSSFTLEAGRKCPSGEGLFTFKVENGELVFNEVQERTRAMKNKTLPHGSPADKGSPPSTPNSPSSPEAQPPLPQRNYGTDPFATSVKSNDIGPRSPPLPAAPPKSPQTKNKKHGILFSKLKQKTEHLHLSASKLRGSKEDLSKRTSSSSGTDDVDGQICDPGTHGSYRHSPLNTPSPHMTPSPNMTRRMLPEIPREHPGVASKHTRSLSSSKAVPKLPLNPPPPNTGGEHIYEDPQLIGQKLKAGAPSEPHYYEYDVTASPRYSPEQYDSGMDTDRCHSSPADLNRPVPLRQESADNGYEEHYSSIPEDDFPQSDGPEYAEPHIGPRPANVSSLLNKLHSDLPQEDTEVYSVAGNMYGSLDLLNAQNRPHSEVTVSDTVKEPLYGRLSAGQLGSSTEYGQGLYANTTKLK